MLLSIFGWCVISTFLLVDNSIDGFRFGSYLALLHSGMISNGSCYSGRGSWHSSLQLKE